MAVASSKAPHLDSLYFGDCLDVMRGWPSGIVDLCYLDPPFNSKVDYNVLFGNEAANGKSQIMAFEDTWHWDGKADHRVKAIKLAAAHPCQEAITGLHVVLGDSGMMSYLSYMADRLWEIRRLLKPDASIFLHCDHSANYYLRILLDSVFGADQFRNEIVWCYTGPGNTPRWFPRKHDSIFFYAKGSPSFNRDDVRVPYVKLNTGQTAGIFKQAATLDPAGKVVEDWWSDITPVARLERERLGYPTQKPRALVERIITAASNPGNVVLDPFCGCGTTVAAARNLNRRWIGIDISPCAIDLVKYRQLKDKDIPVGGVPVDMRSARMIAKSKPFEFERWAVSRVPGMWPNKRQVADRGLDGTGKIHASGEKIVAQVKGGAFHLSHLRDFMHVVDREEAAIGIFITLDPVTSRHGTAAAAAQGWFELGASRYQKVQLWSIADHFAGKLPHLPTLADPYTGEARDQLDLWTA